MKQSIKERVHALRMTFHPNSIKAFIIPSTDPHLSEYVAPHRSISVCFSVFVLLDCAIMKPNNLVCSHASRLRRFNPSINDSTSIKSILSRK